VSVQLNLAHVGPTACNSLPDHLH